MASFFVASCNEAPNFTEEEELRSVLESRSEDVGDDEEQAYMIEAENIAAQIQNWKESENLNVSVNATEFSQDIQQLFTARLSEADAILGNGDTYFETISITEPSSFTATNALSMYTSVKTLFFDRYNEYGSDKAMRFMYVTEPYQSTDDNEWQVSVFFEVGDTRLSEAPLAPTSSTNVRWGNVLNIRQHAHNSFYGRNLVAVSPLLPNFP